MLSHEDNHCYVAVARKRGFLWNKFLAKASSTDYRQIVEFQREMFGMYGQEVKIEIYSEF